MAECSAGTPDTHTDTKRPLYAHACPSPTQDMLPDVEVAPDYKPASICARMCEDLCTYALSTPFTSTALWPSTLDGSRQLAWEGGGVQCWISVCVTSVCVTVITSWTKQGFQGCCCQLAFLWSTARCLGSSLSLSGPLYLSIITGRQKEQTKHPPTHNVYKESVCELRKEHEPSTTLQTTFWPENSLSYTGPFWIVFLHCSTTFFFCGL